MAPETEINLQAYSEGRVILPSGRAFCIRAYTFFGINEIPYGSFVLAPSNVERDLPDSYYDLYDMLRNVIYGDPIEVTFKISGRSRSDQSNLDREQVTFFRGYVEGWGPVTINGKMYLHIWASHWLAPLDWSVALTDKINGIALSDNQLPPIPDKDEAFTPIVKGVYKSSDITEDLWGNVILPEIKKVASYYVFGKDNLADIIEEEIEPLDKSEQPLSFVNCDDPVSVLLDVRRTLYLPEDDELTVWDKLVRLAVRYKFAIVPRIEDFSIAPISYLTGGDLNDYIFKQEYMARAQDISLQSTCLHNAVHEIENVSSWSSTFDRTGRTRRLAKHQAEIDAEDYFRPYTMRVPLWAYNIYRSAENSAVTMGVRESKLAASGYMVEEPVSAGQSVNELYNNMQGNGAKAFAEAELYEQKYKDRTAIFRCPLMFDLSPGSSIAVEPTLERKPDTNNIDHKLYACVRRVCLAIDSQTGKGGTWLLTSHLRTGEEQSNLTLTQHPLYAKRWVRTPLLNVGGFVLQAITE